MSRRNGNGSGGDVSDDRDRGPAAPSPSPAPAPAGDNNDDKNKRTAARLDSPGEHLPASVGVGSADTAENSNRRSARGNDDGYAATAGGGGGGDLDNKRRSRGASATARTATARTAAARGSLRGTSEYDHGSALPAAASGRGRDGRKRPPATGIALSLSDPLSDSPAYVAACGEAEQGGGGDARGGGGEVRERAARRKEVGGSGGTRDGRASGRQEGPSLPRRDTDDASTRLRCVSSFFCAMFFSFFSGFCFLVSFACRLYDDTLGTHSHKGTRSRGEGGGAGAALL